MQYIIDESKFESENNKNIETNPFILKPTLLNLFFLNQQYIPLSKKEKIEKINEWIKSTKLF